MEVLKEEGEEDESAFLRLSKLVCLYVSSPAVSITPDLFFKSSTNDSSIKPELPPTSVELVTVISAPTSLRVVWTESSIPVVIRPNATIVAIPIAIPMIDSALRVLFLNGFLKINVISLILTTPFNIKLNFLYIKLI